MDKTKKYMLKIIIIGEAAVGKTSLVNKFVSGKFIKDYRASIGTNIFIKKIKIENDIDTTIQLWDIAGQERWIKMRRPYYAGARGVIIVGDLTRKNTFDQIEKFWAPDVKQYCEIAPIILLANKNDLKKELSELEVNSLGDKINALSIIYTSAKTGENVEAAFKIISEQAIKTYY
ncbi:MAG: GTP-binding protein [Promethearchaeota archaeon]|nr:MAG: GTP-binding protein [Candidatus Lokiarchaeota archaeon]